MKSFIKCLLILTIVFPCFSCEKTNGGEPVDVIILSGQSNAVGYTSSKYIIDTINSDKYNEYEIGYNNVKICYNCYEKTLNKSSPYIELNKSPEDIFVDTKLGQGKDNNSFGIEIGIAESISHIFTGKNIYLIKVACGGSNIKDDWMNTNSPMFSKLYNYTKSQLKILSNNGYRPIIRAICWMQGESDATSSLGYHASYYNDLKTFVKRIRSTFSKNSIKGDIPFIDAGINNDSTTWPYWEDINNAKKAFASEKDKNIYIDTVSAGLHTDREPIGEVDYPHYDSDSEIKLGHLFAEEIIKIVGNKSE